MDWLTDLNVYMQAFLFVVIVLSVETIANVILILTKPNVKIKNLKMIYAFCGGFLLITGLMGQIVPARSELQSYWEEVNEHNGLTETGPSVAQTSISMLIFVLGIVLAVVIIFWIKKLSTTTAGAKAHAHIHFSDVGDQVYLVEGDSKEPKITKHVSPDEKIKSQLPAVYMVAAHRIPAGLSLGGLIVSLNDSGAGGHGGANPYAMANVISFVAHLIPDLLILYYGYLYSGKTKKKAVLFSLLVDTPLIPMIFVGVALAKLSNEVEWLFWIPSFTYAVVGCLIIWAAIGELLVEVIKNSRERLKYNWVVIWFFLGLGSSMLVQLVHVH